MKLFIPIVLILFAMFCMSLANTRMDPRITYKMEEKMTSYLPKEEEYAVFYRPDNQSFYIGGEEILYHFDTRTMNNDKNYTIKADSYRCIGKPYCKNYVTFVGQLLGKLTVCGTNANNSGCWAMDGETFQKLTYPWAEQLAPRSPVDNYNILITGNQAYSTLSRKSNNGGNVGKTLFRKLHGSNPLLITGDTFLSQPEFVKSVIVEKEDKVQNKILLFFTEDNAETRTLEKRLPMVAQLCKEELGSASGNTRYVFSTALKSRMICGNQLTGQYYPQLQDIYFLQGKTGNVIYGLFKNSWNHSAVCSYEVEDIELLFNTSSLFGSSKKDLKIRPGTCLPSTYTPEETSEEASSYPELTQWLWPSKNRTVLQHVDHYRKIVVDEITAMDDKMYRVLLLATDDGTLHKVVELEDGAFKVHEVNPFKEKGKLQFMDLEPKEHILYMGTTREVSKLYLDDCSVYEDNCIECTQSRDPFCGWIEGKCQSVLKYESSMVQLNQNITCANESKTMLPQGDPTASTVKEVYILICPSLSKHVSYIWKKGDAKVAKCDPSEDICKLILDNVTDPGEYKCIENEMETQRTVSRNLSFQKSNTATKSQGIWPLVLTIQLLITVSHIHMF